MTISGDGAGLATGILRSFLRPGARRPKVLTATHLHEIFEAGYLIKEPLVMFGHMEVWINPEASDAEHQIAYLYKYDCVTGFRTLIDSRQFAHRSE